MCAEAAVRGAVELGAQTESFHEFVDGISFPLIEPHSYFPAGVAHSACLQLLGRLGLSFDLFNTRFDAEMPAAPALYELCRVPRACTIAIGHIINRAVAAMDSEHAFINVGVWHGFSFLSGVVGNADKRCVGVDNFSVHDKRDGRGRPRYRGAARLLHKAGDLFTRHAFLRRFARHRGPHHEFHEMDYVHYFERVHRGPIGVYLYDAQHRYRDQRRGLELAEPFFARGCLILVDDTNARDNRRATLDFIEHSSHRYEVVADLATASNRHPTFWNGLMALRRL